MTKLGSNKGNSAEVFKRDRSLDVLDCRKNFGNGIVPNIDSQKRQINSSLDYLKHRAHQERDCESRETAHFNLTFSKNEWCER